MRPVPIKPTFSALIGVGNRQLLRWVKRDDLRAVRSQDDFFLDARRRNAVGGRTIRLYGEHHSRLELDRLAQRREARNKRPLVQSQAQAVAEIEAEGVHLR